MKFSTVLAIAVALSTTAAVPVTQKVFDIDANVDAMQLFEKPEVDSEQLQLLLTDEAISFHYPCHWLEGTLENYCVYLV